jgi:hypothetical protein
MESVMLWLNNFWVLEGSLLLVVVILLATSFWDDDE